MIVAVVNQKGGVGKTTTAVNLAASIGVAEIPTLLVDMDPQGNASSGVGVPPRTTSRSIYECLIGRAKLEDVLVHTAIPTLDLVPATQDLVAAEIELVDEPDRAYRLRDVLRAALAGEGESSNPDPSSHTNARGGRWKQILIDCPPSLGLLTLNALVAADRVLVPLQCEYYALEGLTYLMDTIDRVKSGPNPDLELAGIVLTMYDPRNNLARQVEAEVKKHFPVYTTAVPRNVRLSEAPSHGKPILLYDARSKGCEAYLALTTEYLQSVASTRAGEAAKGTGT